jgi:endonuclease-8
MDQQTVAGIGNVWKAEACFAAGIDPWRRTDQITDAEALALVDAARPLMQVAVEEGHHRRPRAVYGRAETPCPRCGATIRARGQGDDNRLTYWCAECQH